MEFLLNAMWVVLLLVALGCWLVECRNLRQNRYSRILILGCIAALLFPIISISNDLAAQPLVAEDASAPSKHLQKHTDRADIPVIQQAVLVTTAVPAPDFEVIGRLAGEQLVSVLSLDGPDQSQRAPPSA